MTHLLSVAIRPSFGQGRSVCINTTSCITVGVLFTTVMLAKACCCKLNHCSQGPTVPSVPQHARVLKLCSIEWNQCSLRQSKFLIPIKFNATLTVLSANYLPTGQSAILQVLFKNTHFNFLSKNFKNWFAWDGRKHTACIMWYVYANTSCIHFVVVNECLKQHMYHSSLPVFDCNTIRIWKRKQRVWINKWLKKRSDFSRDNLPRELEMSLPLHYKVYLRKFCSNFCELLEIIMPLIEKETRSW